MPLCIAASLALATACNSGQSSDTNSSDSSATSSTMATDDTSSGMSMGNSDTSKADDRDFVMEAASGGLMEVELGKLAQTNGSSPQVKEFGRMMVTDHTKANTELKAVAKAKNITIPTTPAEKQQKNIDDLKAKKGADFDKDYIDLMVSDHKEDISKFEDESNNGKDTQVKAFATKTLPVLKKHLEHVQTVKDKMK